MLPLPKDFYTSTKELLKQTGEEANNEHSGASKLILSLKEKRLQKLLIYLAYNKTLPQPMPAEEEDLYIQIKKILNKNTPENKTIKVKITKKIPQVITASGNSIGPYEQNEIVYFSDMTDIKFIVDNKLGEMTN